MQVLLSQGRRAGRLRARLEMAPRACGGITRVTRSGSLSPSPARPPPFLARGSHTRAGQSRARLVARASVLAPGAHIRKNGSKCLVIALAPGMWPCILRPRRLGPGSALPAAAAHRSRLSYSASKDPTRAPPGAASPQPGGQWARTATARRNLCEAELGGGEGQAAGVQNSLQFPRISPRLRLPPLRLWLCKVRFAR